MQTTPQTQERSERLLITPREAAQRLSISERLLWQLTADGAIRSVRVGRRGKRYDIRDLVAYIDAQKKGGQP